MSAHYDQGVVLLTYVEERRHVSVCMYCTYEFFFNGSLIIMHYGYMFGDEVLHGCRSRQLASSGHVFKRIGARGVHRPPARPAPAQPALLVRGRDRGRRGRPNPGGIHA